MSSTPNPAAQILETGDSDGTVRSAPLTFAQESLYFINQLTGGLPVYHMPVAFRLTGSFNLEAFTKALNCVVERHEALRTKIVEGDSGPVQEVVDAHEMAIEFYNLSNSGFKHREILEEKLQETASRQFQLSEKPGFRVALFRLSASEHVVLFVLHHILGDMSSLSILLEELSHAYSCFEKNQLVQFSDAPAPFIDYALQDRSEDIKESLNFWADRLEGYCGELEFPLDFTRPKNPSFKGTIHRFEISPALANAIKALARKQRTSVYMVLLSALEVLVYRYTNQNKFTIATPFSSRLDPALEKTIGYLVNLMPLPCQIDSQIVFTQHLHNVRDLCLEALGNSKVSFRQILQTLHISCDVTNSTLSRIVFQYFPGLQTEFALPDITVEPVPIHTGTSKFDLNLSLVDKSQAMAGELEYDTSLFTPATIKSFVQRFLIILEGICTSPESPLSDFDIFLPGERALVESWSGDRRKISSKTTVTQIFEEICAQSPGSTALLSGDETVSYGELAARVDVIARALLARGVSSGMCVGVSLPRSSSLIAVLLSILKCGAAYVPIDANYPQERIAQIIDQTELRIIISDQSFTSFEGTSVIQLSLDQLNAGTDGSGENASFPETDSNDPAYIMFTSGSTGAAKGVVVPHRAIMRLVKNADYADFSSSERFLAFAPISFDASTFEIWGALLNGASLAIYPPQFDSIEQFEEILKKYGVSTLWLTAGLFNTIIDKNPLALKPVKQLLVGGDILSPHHVSRAMKALPDTKFINGYGPTENTTFTCCYKIPPDFNTSRSIPIGKPIANTQVYILDQRLQPVPIGVPGTLHAGGEGLSLGYLNDSDLTRAKFISNPHSSAQEIIYNTGDQARWLEDGNIEFLGRHDTQVKIRGFRIELAEIEAALRKQPSIMDGCAVVHGNSGGEKTLIAYVIPTESKAFDEGRLFTALSKVLPSHLCPSRIVPLFEFPLTANGKVDRKKLSNLPNFRPSHESLVPAANPIESKIAEIWRGLLQVNTLSMTDNLFHVGGDSLIATRAISQINRAFKSKVTLANLFQDPTVRGISDFVLATQNETEPTRGAAEGTEAEVKALSDTEVDSLLSQLISE